MMIVMIMIPHESYYDNYFTIENDYINDTNVSVKNDTIDDTVDNDDKNDTNNIDDNDNTIEDVSQTLIKCIKYFQYIYFL